MTLALAIESPMSRREREKSRSRNRALEVAAEAKP